MDKFAELLVMLIIGAVCLLIGFVVGTCITVILKWAFVVFSTASLGWQACWAMCILCLLLFGVGLVFGKAR